MDTTRRYPRSLAEAFPDERACCIEVPASWPRWHVAVYWAGVVFAIGCLAYRCWP
jgi:hypothetical protein